jgi:hypothetical protein
MVILTKGNAETEIHVQHLNSLHCITTMNIVIKVVALRVKNWYAKKKGQEQNVYKVDLSVKIKFIYIYMKQEKYFHQVLP